LFKGNKAGSGDSENDVSNKRFEPKSSLLRLYLLILRDARESSGYKDERSQLFGYSVAAERVCALRKPVCEFLLRGRPVEIIRS